MEMETTEGANNMRGNANEAANSTINTDQNVVQVAIGVTEDETTPLIELNVKTLDHRLFRIRLLPSSSVPQLKRKIEAETGVITERQRLIFRGKVLKNENNLAFYSLENGHTLHLVVRPLDADPSPAQAEATNTTRARDPNAQSSNTRATPPQIANAPNPQPARTNDEPDPSLLSQGFGNRLLMGATITVPEGANSGPLLHTLLSNIMNTVQDASDERSNGAGTVNAARPTRQALQNASMGQARIDAIDRVRRARTLQRVRQGRPQSAIDSLRELLQRTERNFPPGMQPLEGTHMSPALQTFQSQIQCLSELFRQFEPQLSQLPVALDLLHAPAHQNDEVIGRAVEHASDVLTAFGDLCVSLARNTRRITQRQHFLPQAPSQSRSETNASATPTSAPATTATASTPLQVEENQQFSRLFSTLLGQVQERVRESEGNEAGNTTTETVEFPFENRIEIEATIPVWQLLNLSQPTPQPNTNSWNFEGFVRHLIPDIPPADAIGFFLGDRDALHSVLRRTGMQLFDGVDLPQMSPGTNREWSMRMVAALQDYAERYPRFTHSNIRSATTNLVSQIVHSISPFAPELVAYIIRATNVESIHPRGAPFIESVAVLLGHMARQVYIDFLSHLNNPTEFVDVAEQFLVHLHIEQPFARFLVREFLTLPTVRDARVGGSTRTLDNPTNPESKRRRTDGQE